MKSMIEERVCDECKKKEQRGCGGDRIVEGIPFEGWLRIVSEPDPDCSSRNWDFCGRSCAIAFLRKRPKKDPHKGRELF